MGCGRIGYDSEPSTTLAIDGGVSTPPDATIYDAARSDDGAVIPPIDGGTGILTYQWQPGSQDLWW